jgi:hypothetical protein
MLAETAAPVGSPGSVTTGSPALGVGSFCLHEPMPNKLAVRAMTRILSFIVGVLKFEEILFRLNLDSLYSLDRITG